MPLLELIHHSLADLPRAPNHLRFFNDGAGGSILVNLTTQTLDLGECAADRSGSW